MTSQNIASAEEPVKLQRGEIARIAKETGLSVQHVSEVWYGRRAGNTELVELLKRAKRNQKARDRRAAQSEAA